MKDYLHDWATNILARTSLILKHSVEVEGLRDQHLGGRWETARVKIRVSPGESFLVTTDSLNNKNQLDEHGYLDWAVMGILDVLLVSESYPLKNVSIEFLSAEIHPVNASQMAFRRAGRDAGYKVLKFLKDHAFSPPGQSPDEQR
jgi:hypothetical protein